MTRIEDINDAFLSLEKALKHSSTRTQDTAYEDALLECEEHLAAYIKEINHKTELEPKENETLEILKSKIKELPSDDTDYRPDIIGQVHAIFQKLKTSSASTSASTTGTRPVKTPSSNKDVVVKLTVGDREDRIEIKRFPKWILERAIKEGIVPRKSDNDYSTEEYATLKNYQGRIKKTI